MSKPPCRCTRWKFPHRYELACEDYIPREPDSWERGQLSDWERLCREGHDDRMNDLRREHDTHAKG